MITGNIKIPLLKEIDCTCTCGTEIHIEVDGGIINLGDNGYIQCGSCGGSLFSATKPKTQKPKPMPKKQPKKESGK